MRILLVDDSDLKIKHIMAVITSCAEMGSITVDVAGCVAEAKRTLRDTQYDLLILDVLLPNQPGENATEQGGLELLNQIVTRARYMKPKAIVGVSQFPEVVAANMTRFLEQTVSLLQFSFVESKWELPLRNRIEYMLELSKHEVTSAIPSCDIALITALNLTEFQAVLSLGDWEVRSIPGDPTRYIEKTLIVSRGALKIVAAHAPQMGMAPSAVVTTKILNHFHPRLAVMLGITAGMPNRVRMGDLIVADPCWDWGSGKIKAANVGSVLQPGPMQERIMPHLRSAFEIAQLDAELLAQCWNRYPGKKKPRRVPSLHIGPVATGSSVVSDATARDAIGAQHRSLLGVEMEAFGVLHACVHASVPPTPCLVMKSVVDFADQIKGDKFQEFSAWFSVNVFFEVVKKYGQYLL